MLLAARADFAFGNPNQAGAFFAMLAVAAWALPGRRRPWLRVVISLVSCALLAATASRGAFVGLVVGGFAAWGLAGFPKRTGWLVLFACLALALALGGGLVTRLAGLSPAEGSTDARLAVWQTLPEMVRAAPGGWGFGNAAAAYHNWFQETEDARVYKHLLTSHGTWLAEGGLGFGALYIAGWGLALALASRHPAAFGVWVCWGVAGFFNHLGWDWRLWVLPALMLAVAAWGRGTARWRLSLSLAAMPALVFFLPVAIAKPKVTRGQGRVIVEGSRTNITYLQPCEAVLGRFPGKAIREAGGGSVTQEIPPKFSTGLVVLSGALPPGFELRDFQKVLWLNPRGPLPTIEINSGAVVWGSLRTDAPERAWKEALTGWEWQTIPGRGLFLGSDLAKILNGL